MEIATKEVLSVVVPEVSQLLDAVHTTLHHSHELLTHCLWKPPAQAEAQRSVTHDLALVQDFVELDKRLLECLYHLFPALFVEKLVAFGVQIPLCWMQTCTVMLTWEKSFAGQNKDRNQ